MNKQKQIGFTLLELMITVTILGIIASMAVPSFQSVIERDHLKGAVEGLKSDLMFARVEAIKRGTNLNVTITGGGSTWCYGIDDDNTTCDCTTAGSCAIRAVDSTQFKGVSIPVNTSTDIVFGFRRGTATASNVTMSTTNYSARPRVSNMGRVTICSSDIGGYDAC